MNTHPKHFRYTVNILFLLACIGSVLLSQTPTGTQIEMAKQQLGGMSPEQIDAKIKEYGMTRAEAEQKAKQYGVDLESYLSKGAPAGTPVSGTKTEILQDTSTVKSASPVTMTAAKTIPVQDVVNAKPNAVPPAKSSAGTDYFGYAIFQSPEGSFEPRPFIDEQYVLGEGDVIKISLSGELQSYNEYTVNAEGRILISGIAPILVSGLTVERAKRVVMNGLGTSYSGILRNPPTIFLDLSVARIRPVRIFMTGEVQSPGGYAVSNFGNVFNSLFSVGGPKVSGSLRDIRVIRNNKVIAKVDIYDYLFGSPKSNDVRVNDNDIIFVPLRGKTVTIKGEVLRPYTYELLPGENLKKLIEFSGGFRSNIYIERIQVDRIIPFDERVKGSDDRKIFDIEFAEIVKGKKDYTLEDGDIITMFPILDKKDNYVVIEGDVKRPGRFQIDKIKTVKDLIAAADGLWPTAYLKRAELMREFPDEKLQMIVLDLEKTLANDPSHNIPLQKKDKIKIYNLYDLNPAGTITISGHVKKPGTFPFADSMTIGRLLLSLGGMEDSLFRANTFLERGDIFRLNDDLVTRRRIEFDLAAILEHRTNDLKIMSGDQIRIYALNEVEFLDKTVEIFGNVKKPGKYPLTQGLTVTDLVLLAGGYTQDAWTQQAEVARMMRKTSDSDSLVMITITELPDLFDSTVSKQELLHSKAGSLQLNDKDQLFIRSNPEYKLQNLVTVTGYVRFPGQYAIALQNERLSDIIKRAGGIDAEGYSRGGVLTRAGERLRSNIENAVEDEHGDYDPIMHSGDRIHIPKKPNTVRVIGEVNNPGLYTYVPGESWEFYIERAGDITDSADFILVTFPEGHIEKSNITWFWSGSQLIPDGTVISIIKKLPEKPKTPEEEKRTTFVEIFKETTAIIATTFTILVLANQLK